MSCAIAGWHGSDAGIDEGGGGAQGRGGRAEEESGFKSGTEGSHLDILIFPIDTFTRRGGMMQCDRLLNMKHILSAELP